MKVTLKLFAMLQNYLGRLVLIDGHFVPRGTHHAYTWQRRNAGHLAADRGRLKANTRIRAR